MTLLLLKFTGRIEFLWRAMCVKKKKIIIIRLYLYFRLVIILYTDTDISISTVNNHILFVWPTSNYKLNFPFPNKIGTNCPFFRHHYRHLFLKKSINIKSNPIIFFFFFVSFFFFYFFYLFCFLSVIYSYQQKLITILITITNTFFLKKKKIHHKNGIP